MLNHAGIAEFIILFLIFLGAILLIMLIVQVLYIYSLYKSLKITGIYHNTSPGLAWLLLVPVFNLGWQFYILDNITRGIKGKFGANGRDCGDAANSVGLAFCILVCVNCIPYINIFTIIPCFILWIIYWVKIAGFSKDMLLMQI